MTLDFSNASTSAAGCLSVLTVTPQAFDTRRSDMVEMTIHHIVTLVLISFSWVTGFVRIGSIVMLVHDISDVPLELAKVMN